MKTLMLWECKNGHRWTAPYREIKRNIWCPTCENLQQIFLKKCQMLARKKNGYCLTTNCQDMNANLLWSCKDGHQWTAPFKDIYHGNWCKECCMSFIL